MPGFPLLYLKGHEDGDVPIFLASTIGCWGFRDVGSARDLGSQKRVRGHVIAKL